MENYLSHFRLALFSGLIYAAAGVFGVGVAPELGVLAAVIVLVAGILPNVDLKGEFPAREFAGFLAAVAPLVVIERYPSLYGSGIARVALVVICVYVLTRVVVGRLLEWTDDRGMFHSVPAAVITFQLVYLLFWDLHWFDRAFLATASFVGYFSHLVLDALGNINLIGRALGKAEKKPRVLKFFSSHWGETTAIYCLILILGWIMALDFYPNLRLHAGLSY